MFKFGTLVLLLFLENSFATRKQPSLRGVEVAFSSQRLKQFQISASRNRHSQIRSLLLSEFSGPLKLSNRFIVPSKSLKGACEWNDEIDECSLSISGMKNLLEGSDTEFAELLVEAIECVEKTNKVDCNKEAACLWDEGLDECLHVDWRRNHENSPCAEDAPLFFDTLEATTLCGKEESTYSCENNKQCAWSSEDASCGADSFLILSGVENFQEKATQVLEREAAAVGREYASLRLSRDFTWQSMLDYKPRNVNCPRGIERLVCEYVDASIPHLSGPTFYCSGKYQSAPYSCSADSLCVWDTTSAQCESDESRALSAATLAATRVLIDSMPNEIDRRVHEAVFSCSRVLERGRCYGICVWNPRSGGCEVRENHLAAILAEPVTTSRDALCTYIEVYGSSDCYDLFDRRTCQRREFCRWNAEDECTPNEEFYLSAAADRDRRLKERYEPVKTQCSRHTTEKACLA